MTGFQPRQPGRQRISDHQALDNYLQIDLGRMIFWLRRKAGWIVAAAILGALLAVAYVMVTPPRYTVVSEISVDPAGIQIVGDDIFGRNDQRDTQLLNIDTKLQTLLSRNVLMRVVERLDLTSDAEFVSKNSTVADPVVTAINALKTKATARRDERSFVLTLSVQSRSADKSVRIAETIVEEFRAELIMADAEGARRTAGALESRLAELRNGVEKAEEAVETFRRENGLRVSNGELISTRSMTQIDTQMREARERLIAAESRFNSLTSGGGDFASMQSNTLSSLRTQYAAQKQRSDALAMTYGPRHPRLVAADLELRSLQSEIDAEIARITRAARNEVDQAKAVVTALEGEASEISSDVFSDNAAEVRLRELMREAAAKTATYESFLARSSIATERTELDSTNIRVISRPMIPLKRSWPPSLAQAGVFGGAAGFTLGALAVLVFGVFRDVQYGTGRRQRGRPAPQQMVVASRPTRQEPIREPVEQTAAPHPAPEPSYGSLLNANRRPATAGNAIYRDDPRRSTRWTGPRVNQAFTMTSAAASHRRGLARSLLEDL